MTIYWLTTQTYNTLLERNLAKRHKGKGGCSLSLTFARCYIVLFAYATQPTRMLISKIVSRLSEITRIIGPAFLPRDFFLFSSAYIIIIAVYNFITSDRRLHFIYNGNEQISNWNL